MVKDRVLRILEENRGSLVSGGALGRSIGVSRTAVWKAISTLKAEGFNIEIHKSAGYRLHACCDKLSACGIHHYLNTKTAGRELLILDSVPSTNSHLRKLAEGGVPNGMTVVAERQTSGRGRVNRNFFSPSSGIYMSVLFRPEKQDVMPELLTIAAAVSVSEAIDSVCGVKSSIKWVNDVYIDGKKICGILTEGAIEAESGAFFYLISGIGINVYTPEDGFPEEFRDRAASIEEFSSKSFIRNQLIAEILNRIEGIYLGLSAAENRRSLIERYKERLFMLGAKITVLTAGGSYPAVALDVNESGNLIVEKEDGTVASLSSGEISVRV